MRSKSAALFVALLSAVLTACGGGADTTTPGGRAPLPPPADSSFRHEAAGIRFDIPGGWQSRTDADRMSFVAPDGKLTVVLFTAADEQMGAIADSVNRQIGSLIANP